MSISQLQKAERQFYLVSSTAESPRVLSDYQQMMHFYGQMESRKLYRGKKSSS